jgi:hypothetical protein
MLELVSQSSRRPDGPRAVVVVLVLVLVLVLLVLVLGLAPPHKMREGLASKFLTAFSISPIVRRAE